MEKLKEPFVSIVTPVYNGGKYLAECIESVLDQTYSNWEYVILNNQSTDNTLEIAEKYASGDDRIRVLTTDTFLKQIPNWNESMRRISPESEYCKVVHADDCLFPECIEKMVEKAEQYPTAGVVSSYRFLGSKVYGLNGNGLSYQISFLKGKEAGRLVLNTPVYLFGSPSTLLYRSDLIREKEEFYDQSVLHADVDVCFDVLQRSDFAFVHQLLSFSRMHNESTTTFCEFYNTFILNDLNNIIKFGDYYLSKEEYDEILENTLKEHHNWLAKAIFKKRGKEVWEYHKKELNQMGLNINWNIFSKAYLKQMAKLKPPVKWTLQKFNVLPDVEKDTEVINETLKEKKENTVLTEA